VSLMRHSEAFKPRWINVPEAVLVEFLKPYPRTLIPDSFRDENWDFMLFSQKVVALQWTALLANVNKSASPGVPYVMLGQTNGELFRRHELFIQQLVVERLDRLYKMSDTIHSYNSHELIVLGLADPVRVFVKNEVHTEKKIQSGKVRLICSVSIVDQLVERVLFAAQNRAEIQECDYIPSKPGFGMLEPSAVNQMRAYVRMLRHIGPCVCTDMSTWDFTMQEWEYAAEFRMRAILCCATPADAWYHMAQSRIVCLSNSVYVLSDGRLFMQAGKGIMKSGSYLTSSTNSRVRALCAFLNDFSPSMTMGDDCVEVCDDISMLVAHYAKLGHIVKDLSPVPEDVFEFCSHSIGRDTIIPTNWIKMTINFLLKGDYEELSVRQYKSELKDAPIGAVRAVLIKAGVPPTVFAQFL